MIALSWSGGKDCAAALWRLRASGTVPAVLLTTVDEHSGAVAHHGVPAGLLRAQAAAVGIPLVEVAVPRGGSNAVYEERLRRAFATPPLDRVAAVAFGDLFLEDLRRYRTERLAEAGLEATFPLWGSDTGLLARDIVRAGFRATVVSVDLGVLGPEHLGRAYDERFLDDLPPGADPCGERGEFHTFVHDGPVFAAPVAFEHVGVTAGPAHAWAALGAPRHHGLVPAVVDLDGVQRGDR